MNKPKKDLTHYLEIQYLHRQPGYPAVEIIDLTEMAYQPMGPLLVIVPRNAKEGELARNRYIPLTSIHLFDEFKIWEDPNKLPAVDMNEVQAQNDRKPKKVNPATGMPVDPPHVSRF